MTVDAGTSAAMALPAYEVGGELGRGGFGVVVAGRHRQLGREVAIKQLPPALAVDPAVRGRFVREARVLASLDHPHIVPVYDYVEHDGVCLLVMESLPGGTVWDSFQNEGMPQTTSCAIVLVTCAGLQYAHDKGVLHRDVKPENLLFNRTGQLKVTDFGIAKVVGGSDALATTAGEILGTPAYMAPEQAEGKELGPPADVYASGAMLYELLSGRLPFSEEGGGLAIVYRHVFEQPTPLRDVAPQVPVQVADVVMRALARDPAERFATAEDFGVALGEAATAAFGPDWLVDAQVPVLAGGRILASVQRPTVPAGPQTLFGRQTASPGDSRSTIIASNSALGSADARATVTPGAPGGGPADPAEGTTSAGGALPPGLIPEQRVRPSVAVHVRGPSADRLTADGLVPVRQVLNVPKFPRASLAASVALLAVTGALAVAGLGDPATGTRTLPAGTATLQGADVTGTDPVRLDVSKPLVLRVGALPAEATGSDAVQMRLSVLGVQLPASSTGALIPDGPVLTTQINARSNDYLAAGVVEADLVFQRGGEETVTHRFTAQLARAPWLTVPGVAVAVAFLFLLAYLESLLSPLRRRGRHSVVKLLGSALVAGALGAVGSCAAALFALHPLTVPGLAAAAVAGAAAGAMLAVTMAQVGRRSRVRRVARKLEAAKAAGWSPAI